MTRAVYTRAPALLVFAAITPLLGDILQVTGTAFASTVVATVAFILFAAGVLLLPQALGIEDRTAAVAGSLLAFVGAIAGAAMQVLFRTWAVLEAGGATAAVTLLQNHASLRLTTLVPGILFPLGLLLLALGLHLSRRVRPTASFTLVAGAILFPVGHAAGIIPALILGDIVLLAAFLSIQLAAIVGPPTAD